MGRSDELVVDPIHQPSRIQTLMQLATNWDELQCSSGPSGTIGTGQKYRKQYTVQYTVQCSAAVETVRQSAQLSEKCL